MRSVAKRHDLFPNDELIASYRKVFSSEHGKEVLSHMLFDLGTFLEVSESDLSLKNYGVRLLQILGGSEPTQESIKLFMDALMRQPLPRGNKK